MTPLTSLTLAPGSSGGFSLQTLRFDGNSEVTARAVAKRLGIDEVEVEVLPERKAEFVNRLEGRPWPSARPLMFWGWDLSWEVGGDQQSVALIGPWPHVRTRTYISEFYSSVTVAKFNWRLSVGG